jgi:2-succinyl-5-enolpyruvyl-6-hydroxy-3-cyclohexene-1-carboxylate synthase
LNNEPFGEFRAVQLVLDALPGGGLLQLGNSMPIRYANFVGVNPEHAPFQVNANRGASGIDGCVSTAVGAASTTSALTTLIVGDLAFFYDRNGLWQRALPPNLRIVLLNNHGGGIFDIIDGPNRLDADTRTTYFLTPQPLSAQRTALDHGLRYHYAAHEEDLLAALPAFFAQSGGAALLEVETEMAINRRVFQAFREMVGSLHL